MTTFNTTLIAGTNQYFDLHDYASDITEVYVAAQVAQSTAWRIDTAIVAAARQVFKSVREQLFVDGIDQMAELTNALQEQEFSAQSFADAGLRDTLTLETIRGLAAQRDQWHALAAHLTSMTSDYSGAPRKYETPELEDVFYKEPNLKVNQTTQRRMAVSSQKIAEANGLDDAGAKLLLARRLQREEDNVKSINTRLVEQASGMYFMYLNAIQTAEDAAPTEFYKLPLDTQRLLLANAQQAAQRADDWACKERGMSDIEYTRILGCVIKINQDLKKVLTGPRFVAAQRVAEAGTV